MTPALPLKPIHLPPAPSWWPPAPGWWIAALLALLLIALGVWLLLRWHQARQKKRWLDAALARLSSSPNGATELHRLLRRALQPLVAASRNKTHLNEPDWLALLEQLAGAPLPDLLQLEAARYQPTTPLSADALAQAERLLRLALLQPRQAKKRLARSALLEQRAKDNASNKQEQPAKGGASSKRKQRVTSGAPSNGATP